MRSAIGYLNYCFAVRQRAQNRRQVICETFDQYSLGGVSNSNPNNRRTFVIKRSHEYEILIFGNEHGAGRCSMGPNVSVGGFRQADVENMRRLVPMLRKIRCQAWRQLRID
ncbi:MAG: hypothetical protein WBB34_22595 [Xanthobacteraceae bacterium]